jgi:hypothetical protein
MQHQLVGVIDRLYSGIFVRDFQVETEDGDGSISPLLKFADWALLDRKLRGASHHPCFIRIPSMFSRSQKEHQWLSRLAGNWDFEHDCTMPDGSVAKSSGKMVCRMLGELWLICESAGTTPDGNAWSSIMTIGFDPTENAFVGTFIGSMMANIWHYRGGLDSCGATLPLECEGPKFDGSGIGKYRDTIKIIDENVWLFTSDCQIDDGTWKRFMCGKHRRV